MKRFVDLKLAQLVLFVIVLILFWSVIVRFPWVVAVGVAVLGVFLFATRLKEERG